MQSERKSPLLIFGTPLGNWYPLVIPILKEARFQGEDPYENWHRDLWGGNATEFEVGLSRIDLPKLEIPAQHQSEMEKLAEDGVADPGLAGASAYGCWTADYWLKALPSATCLVFYEHPSRMTSRYLGVDPSASMETLLSIWSAGAQKIVSAVRRHRDRVYLLNVAECLKYEEKYLQWVEKHLGIILDQAVSTREPLTTDSGLTVLAEILCSENSLITNLSQELDASAQPLGDEWSSSNSSEPAQSAATALNELLALRGKSAEFEARNRECENKISQLEIELLALRGKSAEFEARNRECENKISQLEIELLALRGKSAEFEARNRECENKISQLEIELLALRGKSAEFEARNHECENKISQLNVENEQYKQLALLKEKEALIAHEKLLMELHQSFQESEHYFEKWKGAESSGKELSLKVASVIRGDLIDESEHRHINYIFRNVELFGRHWPILRLRLVRHRGNAGIVFFSEDSLPLPLYSWVPSGSENDTPYVLYVPANGPARKALVRATTSDLVLVGDSVSLIRSDLCLHGLPENSQTNWIHVAERLLQEIDELPERLHYDSVKTEPKSLEGREPLLFFDVLNASFRGRIISSLRFSWSPSAVEGDSASVLRIAYTRRSLIGLKRMMRGLLKT